MEPATEASPADLARSFVRVRQAIGVLGIALPFLLLLLALAERYAPPTISDSYYHYGRDIFVGTLLALGAFLVSYSGHARKPDERFSDGLLSTVAGVAVIVVALVPTKGVPVPFIHEWLTPAVGGGLHYVAALVFFVCMAIFCLGQFRLGPPDPTRAYLRRVYAVCGWIIVGTILLMGALAALQAFTETTLVGDTKAIFVLESVGVVAFGAAWLLKGEAMRPRIRRRAEASPAAQDARSAQPPDDLAFRILTQRRRRPRQPGKAPLGA
jgi:hypothetical protein